MEGSVKGLFKLHLPVRTVVAGLDGLWIYLPATIASPSFVKFHS